MRASLTMTTTVLVGLLFYLAFAATGQIDGRITDRTTGEPVIGASVQVVGTSLGARTDIDGHYRIPRVIPGTYSLEVTHHDYNTYRLDSVVVLEGITKVANFALGRDSTDLGKTIEVRSSAEVIDKFLTESKTTITSEGIKTKPVQTVDALFETVATVKTNQTGEIHIRGGRAPSISYIVDGVPVGDPLGGIETQGSLVEPKAVTLPPAHGGSAIVNNEPYDAMFFENHGVNPFVDTEDDHLSTFAADVDDASFILSRSYLREGSPPDKDAVRVEEFVNHFEYAYESPEHDAFGVTIEGAPSRFGPSNAMLLRIGVKGREIADADRKPANLVFVIDISGSMATDDRLGLVQQSLRLLTNRLKPEDRVGIVVYGSVGEVRLEPTEIRHRSNILDVINKLVTTGATNAEAGIRLGYQMAEKMFSPDRINRIILCSDGVANVGRTGPDQILAEIERYRTMGITLTTIGFGMGNYNDILMEKLANSGDGVYAYVDDIAEARKLLVDNLAGTLETIARDVKIQVDFNPKTVRSYRLLGYENRDVVDAKFRDDAEDGGEIGAGHTTTALYELKLHQNSNTDLVATVFIRHKSPDADKVVSEVSYPVVREVFSTRFDNTTPDFRLAAAAAEFAEILRESYWARDASLADVKIVAQSVSDTRRDPEITEFVDLITRALELQEIASKQ